MNAEKTYTCKECSEVLTSLTDFRDHLVHHDITNKLAKVYKCLHCGNSFKTRRGLSNHAKAHEKKCEKCLQPIEASTEYSSRPIVVENKNSSKNHNENCECSDCGLDSPEFSRKHEGKICEKCLHPIDPSSESHTCPTLKELTFHECTECELIYKSLQGFRRHLRKHKEKRCDGCFQELYRSLEPLTRAEIENQDVLQCHECGLVLSSHRGLTVHLQRHTKRMRCYKPAGSQKRGRRYLPKIDNRQCDECGKRFVTHNGLARHVSLHSRKKTYLQVSADGSETQGFAGNSLANVSGENKGSGNINDGSASSHPGTVTGSEISNCEPGCNSIEINVFEPECNIDGLPDSTVLSVNLNEASHVKEPEEAADSQITVKQEVFLD